MPIEQDVDMAKAIAKAGLGIATVAFPGAQPAILLTNIAIDGAAALFLDIADAIMDQKPENVTNEEWRAHLRHRVLNTKLGDRLDEKLNPPQPAPAPNLGDVMGSAAPSDSPAV